MKFCIVVILLKSTSSFLVELKKGQLMYAIFIYQGLVFIMVFPTCMVAFNRLVSLLADVQSELPQPISRNSMESDIEALLIT